MLSGGAEEFPDEKVLINLGSGADSWADSDEAGNTLVSAIARVNYKYNNRYLATFTFRTDGSSKFRTGQALGIFPFRSARLGDLRRRIYGPLEIIYSLFETTGFCRENRFTELRQL